MNEEFIQNLESETSKQVARVATLPNHPAVAPYERAGRIAALRKPNEFSQNTQNRKKVFYYKAINILKASRAYLEPSDRLRTPPNGQRAAELRRPTMPTRPTKPTMPTTRPTATTTQGQPADIL